MRFLAILLTAIMLTGCAVNAQPIAVSDASSSQSEVLHPTVSAAPIKESSAVVSDPEKEQPDLSGCTYIKNYYVCSVIDNILEDIITPDMTDYDKILAIYKYLIVNTYFADNMPVGLDVWQYRGDPANTPSIMEVRSISPLVFGIGSCEDYAAALVTMCDRLGIAAKYVPGLTYSVDGVLVDHAWAMVKLDGEWYHIDPQLEDNIIRGSGLLRYRYFLKSDSKMGGDHRWGSLLENPSEYALNLPSCTAESKEQPPETVRQAKTPDRKAIEAGISRERAIFLRTNELPQYEIEGLPD